MVSGYDGRVHPPSYLQSEADASPCQGCLGYCLECRVNRLLRLEHELRSLADGLYGISPSLGGLQAILDKPVHLLSSRVWVSLNVIMRFDVGGHVGRGGDICRGERARQDLLVGVDQLRIILAEAVVGLIPGMLGSAGG